MWHAPTHRLATRKSVPTPAVAVGGLGTCRSSRRPAAGVVRDAGATDAARGVPASHRRYAEVTPQGLRERAARIGPATAILVDVVLRDRPHPEQGFRAGLGILRLVRPYGPERVEAACRRGLDIGAVSYGSVLSILRTGLDRTPRPEPVPDEPPVRHENVRGGGYYH